MDEANNLLDGLDIDIPLSPGSSPAGPGSAQTTPEQSPGIAAEAVSGGHFFGTYQLLHEVGSGGVARVWRARHIHPGYEHKTFAIKIMQEEVSRDPTVVDLFRHEAYVLSILKHPNIVETFEAGTQEGKLFIAMEYIDGRDLDNTVIRCQKTKIPVPIHVWMHIVGETLKALAYAHDLCDADANRLNLVHRDVNPSNVFLSYDGRVKLGDFGVASIAAGRVEKERELAGKVGYFAPEQLEGEKVDQRADLFALGVMMFELLCGTRLFQAETTEELLRLNRKAKIPKPTKVNPNIPQGLEDVMLAALERKPADRVASARAMFTALQPFIPEPATLPLAVAGLMRKAFLSEHIQELQIKEGLTGKVTRGSGQLVAVCTPDERARAAFNELLVSRGYKVEAHAEPKTLGPSFHHQAAAVAVVDVSTQGFRPEPWILQLASAPKPIPVVAVSENLDMNVVGLAHGLGAVDLLFKPFNIERVLTSVRAAIAGAVKVASVEKVGHSETELIRPRALLLSHDPALVSRLTEGLAGRGYELDVSPTTQEALERIKGRSYHVVIYDAHPASASDRLFAGEFRGQPGMGLAPILYLAAPESHLLFSGVDADRSAVRPREDPVVVLCETLKRLRGDTRLGRTFIRYDARFKVDVRYGGRVFVGIATDVSRGGVMVECSDQMPPVGTAVGLTLSMPTGSAVDAQGRVVRVDLGQNGTASRVGVEFESFAARGEADLITFIAGLDKTPAERRQTTMILKALPVARE